MIFVFNRLENIVGKEENAGSHDVFKRPTSQKSCDCVVKKTQPHAYIHGVGPCIYLFNPLPDDKF